MNNNSDNDRDDDDNDDDADDAPNLKQNPLQRCVTGPSLLLLLSSAQNTCQCLTVYFNIQYNDRKSNHYFSHFFCFSIPDPP